MSGSHHCLGRGAPAPNPAILCELLQRHQNSSILGQGCAGFSPGSANRCDQFTRHPGRTSSPLRPCLSFRYTHQNYFSLVAQILAVVATGSLRSPNLHKRKPESSGLERSWTSPSPVFVRRLQPISYEPLRRIGFCDVERPGKQYAALNRLSVPCAENLDQSIESSRGVISAD